MRCRVGSVRPSNFYPRSPCGERLFLSVSSASAWQFLSTLSLRRATSFDFCIICLPSYFYPRSPCGERLQSLTYGRCVLHFYPRSPCGERPACAVAFKLGQLFLSTLSLRRATALRLAASQSDQFLSTLSLRRATIRSAIVYVSKQYFYPRSPCGERQGCCQQIT